jgi:toxin-antitoxin system PIN domain toxin
MQYVGRGCLRWFGVMRGSGCVGGVVLGVRITTNLRAFRTPSSIQEAFGFCEDLLGQPHCQIVEPGDRHWNIFRRLCIETDTRGSLVTDAWFAALAIEWGCEWITLDRDYARFPGLKWQVPMPCEDKRGP